MLGYTVVGYNIHICTQEWLFNIRFHNIRISISISHVEFRDICLLLVMNRMYLASTEADILQATTQHIEEIW